jgi:hypothetical protein
MFQPVARYLRQQGWTNWSLAQIETDAIVWWIFRKGESQPAMVGKVPRTPLDCEIARREARALRELEASPGELGIPRLLFQTELDDGRFIFLQSAVPGRPIANRMESIGKLTPWLERFQGTTSAGRTLAEATRSAAARCAAALPDLHPKERELLALAERLAPGLESLPASPVHGDFWAGNVLEAGGRFSVIDWSNFHNGSPVEDVHNFAAAVGDREKDIERRTAGMWSAFFGDSPLMGATQEATRRLLHNRGFAQDTLRACFILFLITRIACLEFSNHAAWRRLAARYMESGSPEPFAAA